MDDYSLEELLPVVAALTEKYTCRDSSSVTYEVANRLMEAVLYCINECNSEGLILHSQRLTAKEAYERGLQRVQDKTCAARKLYNTMVLNFNSYGNENYYDTVTKALPGFFKLYDIHFAPQESIITMDYPTICPISGVSGIDAVEKYISYISIEQRFLGRLPGDYVLDTLYQFHKNYRKQFYNICRIIYRDILVHILAGRPVGGALGKDDYDKLRADILGYGKAATEEKLKVALGKLIDEKYDGDEDMLAYLGADIEDYCMELGYGIMR